MTRRERRYCATAVSRGIRGTLCTWGLLCVFALNACGSDASPAADTGPDAGPADAATDATTDAAGPCARRLIWFGPHPDDEFYVAPILGHYCVDEGWDCSLVVFTRGEGGGCSRPEGCSPDLATVRAEEMRASAALFGAELEHWDLGDNGRFEAYDGDVQDVFALWLGRAGGEAALLERVTAFIRDRDPDLVLAVDWRHGNYCHPTHRAAGAVVGQALVDMGDDAPPASLVESRPVMSREGFVPFVAEDPAVEYFDATIASPSLGGEAWGYVLEVIRAHRSQFQPTPAQEAAFLAAPAERKRVFTLPFDRVMADDARYQGLCPPSTY